MSNVFTPTRTANLGLVDDVRTDTVPTMHKVTEHDFFTPKSHMGKSKLIPVGGGVYRFGAELAMAGGADSPLQYPLFQSDPSGTMISIDEALQEPERITRDVADLAMQRFFMDKIYSDGGGVKGGGLLFERPNPLATDLYGERDPKEVAPGGQFPLQTFARGVPMIARPRKIGNKFWVSKEAKKRNDTNLLARYMRQTANSIRRRLENLGLAELTAVTTAETRFSNGTDWSTYAGLALDVRTGTSGPVADSLAVLAAAEIEERGHRYDSMILHPTNALEVQQAFPGQSLLEVFRLSGSGGTGSGISNVYVTPRATVGRAILFEQGQVGVWKNEFPLEEDVWDDKSRQITYYQWSISPLFAIVDQFALWELRAL